MWKQIAATKGIESRHVLQAWRFLRDAGVAPPPEVALVQAAVAQVAANDQHDLLVAYRDGSARYLDHGGEVVVVDHVGLSALDDAVAAWLAVAEQLAQVLGVWDQAELPALPRGHTRVLMSTPAGPRFGQSPDDQLRADAGAASFLAAATLVLKVMTNLT